ncbi:uncharacterized protein PGTG_03766 [Puccinia graminis f. sp. tritici CRL 75-36-700-3]|uniref:NEDD8-activating enzyme E1 regulatory subunit n=1 Tax=Puccinia graminis f. sp. tritici (strain CRL 75-36-700-3 / race SCCL) TaxID=418459 RepID=E3K0I5_PUCGT|nr:uncharacterized protein PGTG_03766 [Puccinia graminis f. sp. tritici CRL 75-36-700-3]EFP77810.2 hypothetical protein PGTG_03766 [Puccinia graminis f. sp. tritici CRL 75-36-700-3]
MKREAEVDSSESPDKIPKTMADNHRATQESAFISPSSARPDRQTQLFDRQLRLWESSGQKRFEEGAVGICDCSSTSAQIAKNLVLSGIRMVEMFDKGKVRQSDIGNHFFLEQASLGKSRAVECSRLLGELSTSKYNPVHANDDEIYDSEHWDGIEDYSGLAEWTAKICVRMLHDDEQATSRYCWDFNVPAILVQTCGLVASIRLQIRELSVIQTHSKSLVDLRLDCPFPSLLEYVNSFEMDKMDSHEHAHVPAVVIIIHFLEIFKSKHDGKLPQGSAERAELKQMILAEKRGADEDNFDEAVSMIWKACQPTKVPTHVEELFNDSHCEKLPWFDGRFWLLVKSLREFVARDPSHRLPLSGVLPDMKSDTKNYIKMQAIYRQKAAEDLKAFKEIVNQLAESIEDVDEDEPQSESGHYHDPPQLDLYSEMVETFVKNSAHIRVIRGRRYGSDVSKDFVAKFQRECEPENEETTATWYLAFEALSAYRTAHQGEYPGIRKGQEEEDERKLSSIAHAKLKAHGLGEAGVPEKLQQALKEMVRSAGSELPHISSLVGGLVSQEVIKLITRQYIPMNGTCIYDGYRSATGIIEY